MSLLVSSVSLPSFSLSFFVRRCFLDSFWLLKISGFTRLTNLNFSRVVFTFLFYTLILVAFWENLIACSLQKPNFTFDFQNLVYCFWFFGLYFRNRFAWNTNLENECFWWLQKFVVNMNFDFSSPNYPISKNQMKSRQ